MKCDLIFWHTFVNWYPENIMKCGLRSQGEAACECDAHARHPNLSIPTPTFRSIAIKRNNGITTVQSAK